MENKRTVESGLSLMQVLSQTNELDIFSTDLVADIIDYKWKSYAYKIHSMAFIVHLSYVIVLIYYCNKYYLNKSGSLYFNEATGLEEQRPNISFQVYQGICLVIPLIFEFYKLKQMGSLEYFASSRNYLDISHIFFGFVNIYFQQQVGIEVFSS